MPPPQNQQPIVIKNKSCKRYFLIQSSKVYFTADFDSGNLQKVQQISPYIYKLTPGFDKTRFSSDKTFFHFKVSGFKLATVKFIVTRQNLLEKFIKDSQHTYRPVFRINNQQFQPLKNGNVKIYKNNYQEPQLSFQYTFYQDPSWVQFAFSYPYSYEDNQKMIDNFSKKFANHDEIYFHNQVLGYSLDQRKIHLITVTQKINCISKQYEGYPNVQGMFPQINSRPNKIEKPKVVISGRVHPGETPGSYCVQGLLNFLLNEKDYRAYLLRKNFHFIIVPMLNPDGVYDGMFRSDPLGHNLNRYYKDCTPKKHPTIYFFRKYLQTINNVLFYFDFHAHPSKKGFFIYGNAFDQFIHQVEAQTFGKMIQSNCPYFECLDSIFSQKQMIVKEKNENVTKQGCGRVFVHRLFGNIIHSYTVECGYFSPNKLNFYPKIKHEDILSGDYSYDDSYENNISMKQYTPDSYRLMGKSILITILDVFHINPYTRVTLGQFKAISSIRKANAMRIYHQAQRFRMIDSNCYKKAKDIKEKAQQYYVQRFSKYGLNISDNYGMKVKKKTFKLNPKYYLKRSKKVNINQKNPQIQQLQTYVNQIGQEIKQQKPLEKQIDRLKQNQLLQQQEQEDQQSQLDQNQIQIIRQYQSSKQIEIFDNQNQLQNQLYQSETLKAVISEKNINKVQKSQILSTFHLENYLLNIQKQDSSKFIRKNPNLTLSMNQILSKTKIIPQKNQKISNFRLSSKIKEKYQQKQRAQTMNKDYQVFKKNLKFINDVERSQMEFQQKAPKSQRKNKSEKKDNKLRRQSQSGFKFTRIGLFLERQSKKSQKKISIKKQNESKNLPALYKKFNDTNTISKQLARGIQIKQTQKLPGLY